MNRIDTYFASKKVHEKWMVILGMVLIIGYMSYFILFPYSANILKLSEHKKNILKENILNKEQFISKCKLSIHSLLNEIAEDKKRIIVLKKELQDININLEKVITAVFSKDKVSSFLNVVTEFASAVNVKIEYISNTYIDSNESFAPVLKINTGCKGSYKNLTKFIDALEQYNLMSEIEGTHLTKDISTESIMADINISVWGIKNS